MVQKPQSDAERKERRIDLSLPQVAGSAVAAVAAAVMASQLGVYGTIAGAGVMSVVATCGGSVFQHFFRRTGEQIREVTVQVKHPAGRQVTVRTRETTSGRRRPGDDATTGLHSVDPTTVLRGLEPGEHPTTVLRGVEPGEHPTTVLGRSRPGDLDRTTMLRRLPQDADPAGARPGGGGPGGEPPQDAYSDARTHGTRVRGWKRSALAATGVFVLSMAGITVYELASGHDLGGNGGTTVGSVVRGDSGAGATSPEPPAGTGGTGEKSDGEDSRPAQETTTPGTDSGEGRSTRPGTTGDDGSTADPTPTPSVSGGTTPEPPAPTTPGDGATSGAPDPTATDGAPAQEDGAAGAEPEG
ncbi:hypothetical protein ACFY8O_29405 [Streptomyces argenteolus]|uniref:Uncharacterized protein n=1 Tax=Streptomyces argenteolus TaxID=67274 RepID=A0ABW6XE44_9ACTN